MDWEKRLKAVFDEIDRDLETRYGERWPLHPSRPLHGATSNPEMDGLFNVGAAYSAGFGSKKGPGYVVDIRMATLKNIPKEIRKQLHDEVLAALRTKLPQAFPAKALEISEENGAIRIHGDLSLN